MKFNKKLVVATLSTALGLGIVGSITGTVAWYQYSTRATTSIIGSSGGKTGVLQIKMAGAEDSTYTRDLYTATLTSGRSNTVLYPCTFGGIDNNVALPATAKRNPSVGVGNPENWADATSAVDYIQYSVTLRAQQYNASTEQVEPLQNINIYLSDIMLEDADTTAGDLTSALRMHIHTNDGTTDKYFLIGSAATTLDTYGHLDVDGDGVADKVGGYETDPNHNNVVMYGVENSQQKCMGISDVEGTTTAIGKTNASGTLNVTVTLWLEGWAQLNPYTSPNTDVKAMWSNSTIGKTIHAGLTFDVDTQFDA